MVALFFWPVLFFVLAFLFDEQRDWPSIFEFGLIALYSAPATVVVGALRLLSNRRINTTKVMKVNSGDLRSLE